MTVLFFCGVREDWGGISWEMRREKGQEVRLSYDNLCSLNLLVKIKCSWLCLPTDSKPGSWRGWKACLEAESREAERGFKEEH